MNMNSPAPHTEKLAKKLGWATLTLSLIVLLLVAYTIHVKSQSADFTRRKVDCINSTLGQRQKFTDADNANEAQKIADQTKAQTDQNAGAEGLLTAKTPAEGQAAFALFTKGQDEFLQSLANWQIRHNKIDAARKLIPLGAC
jgi:hypothetical protein